MNAPDPTPAQREADARAAETLRHIEAALSTADALGAVLARLHAELSAARLDRANLLAAMRATLAADADGEADPLYYVRDELQARYGLAGGHGEAS